jgi:murein DD-endopeptidase MepM/ murein hydrolase activator NlpD
MRDRGRLVAWNLVLTLLATAGIGGAAGFQLPTANRALFEPGGEERFFVGTAGRGWESGTFGGVRSGGYQLHEGLDIRSLQRDKRGEPTDPVMASAEGTVAYINRKSALSNFGIYVILQHRIDGIEVYTTYAHLREARADLHAGTPVKTGEVIGVMGRTANTGEGISKDRAHVHFEIGLLLSDNFASWHRKFQKGQRNDHGNWNGQAMRGLDPREILLRQHREGDRFRLVEYIRNQTELCRVQVRDTEFPWLRRYPSLVARNPRAEKEGVVGYEIWLNYVGLPYRMMPLASGELKSRNPVYLVSVNDAERTRDPSGKVATQRNGNWVLTNSGQNLISLITY